MTCFERRWNLNCLNLPDISLKVENIAVAVRQKYNGFFSENKLFLSYCLVVTILATLTPEVQGEIFLQ